MKKKSSKTLPDLASQPQVQMWNTVYCYGCMELLTQKQRRTAFAIQRRTGKDSKGNNRVRVEENANTLEFIFFSEDFAEQVGARKFDKFHCF